MCTLAIFFKVFTEFPVVIAANRDEFLARPATMPTVLWEEPRIIGGKDLQAGGTWLGINQYGMLAGLLNRRAERPADLSLRSRGLLCLDVLRRRNVAEALAYVAEQDPRAYNPFNLLMASREQAAVANNHAGRMTTTILTPGIHLLTNLDVDDAECPRISQSFAHFAELARQPELGRQPAELRRRLITLLADHSTQLDSRSGRPNSLCIHLGDYGTRESSLIFMAAGGTLEHYFAPGAPCVTPYAPAAVPTVSAG